MTDTSQVTGTIAVLEKYNSLVQASLGGDSVYIRAKETMEQLFQDGDVNSTDKALAITTTVSNLVNAITSSSMSTALEWSKYEKELELKKLELDAQLLILGQEKELKTAQVDQVKNQTRLSLVESKRVHGTGTFDTNTGALISLDNTGKIYNDMQMVTQQTANAVVENNLLLSKINESQVAIHKVVADTYVNYGSYTFVQAANGVTSVTATHAAHVTLSMTQKDIAVEQGKGYAYNAWANALTGSASMLGTAIASDYFDFSAGSTGTQLLDTVLKCAEGLQAANTVDTDATPVA